MRGRAGFHSGSDVPGADNIGARVIGHRGTVTQFHPGTPGNR